MTTATQGHGHPARGEADDGVHRADVGPDAFVDPSGGRTVCGQRVIEVYNDRRDVTCPLCSAEG